MSSNIQYSKMRFTPKQISLICDFWTECISNPKFNLGSVNALESDIAKALSEDIPEIKKKRFKKYLREYLTNHPEISCISSDYSPDNVLAYAMDMAKISPYNCSYKTITMLTYQGRIISRDGYGQPDIYLD